MLQCILQNNHFPSEAFGVVGSIVSATADIYNSAISYLLPTPAKSHYMFNLRDFARVIQGCCLIRKEVADTKKLARFVLSFDFLTYIPK